MNPTGLSLRSKKKNLIGNIDILIKELCKLPKEVGWVEFKHNNCEPNMIGEDRAITECNYYICNNIIAID